MYNPANGAQLTRAVGETVADEDLVRNSPLMRRHIIPNDIYRFANPKPGGDIA